MTDAQFPRMLAIEPVGERQDAQIEIEAQACGISASLLTSIKIKNSTMSRTLEHARVTFVQKMVLPEPVNIFSNGSETGRRLYSCSRRLDLSRVDSLWFVLSKHHRRSFGFKGRRAGKYFRRHGEADDSFLGSPFVLDATMHAACVWGQRFTDIVPFPVGFDQRIIYAPAKKGGSYHRPRCAR